MKILTLAACVVDLGSDAGGEHCDARTVIDPRADVAHGLVRLGRALYVHEKDDPTRTKHLTARPEQLPAPARPAKPKPPDDPGESTPEPAP